MPMRPNLLVGSGENYISLPTVFPISTATHRKPFYGFTMIESLKVENNQYLYFWTELDSFTSTLLTMSVYYYQVTNTTATEDFGFMPFSHLKFRYLLIRSTFPNKYLSIGNLVTGLSYSIAAGSFKELTYKTTSFVSPAPFTLSAANTVFIHTLTDVDYQSTKTVLDNSFEISLAYRVINSTDFAVKIMTKYPVVLYEFQLKVFIYNKADFDNLYVKIDQQIFTFASLPLGTTSTLTNPYVTLYIPTLTTDIFFGIQGFEFSLYQNIGFEFTILSTGGKNYDVKVRNLWATSGIPRLDLLVLLPSQFRCPYFELLIDQTLTTCYNTSCPTSNFNSSQALGLTDIYVCKPCISTCYQCSKTASNCTSCYGSQNRELVGSSCAPKLGFYEGGIDVAPPCDSNCLKCTASSTFCTSCPPTKYLSFSNICEPCSTYSQYCLTCNASRCNSCDSSAGYILSSNSLSCIACTFFDANCISCTNSACTRCNATLNFSLDPNSLKCITCTIFGSQCLTCDSSVCLSCSNGFFLTSNGTCQACTAYGQQCIDCSQSLCIKCSQGFSVLQSKCQNLNPVCGDGIWVFPQETCDDGNLLNDDGCDSKCRVQEDYVCLLADKLPSGASFCKFTKNITIELLSMEKEDSSNKLHLFLTLGPSTFKLWTQQSIIQLLSPIEIHDSDGNAIQIPLTDMNLVYHKNEKTGQIQLVIDYGQNNLEGSSINFNIKPDQTNHDSLQEIPVQNDLLLKLNSQGSGLYFHGYSQETYEKQRIIRVLSTIVGIVSLIFAFLGLFIPGGKLIVLQALTVIQIGYFSLLSFEKVPPTFLGLKCLDLSNGYNDLKLVSSKSLMLKDIFSIMGLKTMVFSNYNITFVLFVIFPMMIGLIGFLIKSKGRKNRIMNVNKSASAIELFEDVKNDACPNPPSSSFVSSVSQPSFGLIIFERILYENTFYGLYFGGYLACVSILHSFTQPQTSDYLFLLVIALLWISYGLLFIRSQNDQISLNAFPLSPKKEKKTPEQNDNQQLKISTQFGQFGEVYKQLMPSTESQTMKKFYLIFVVQKVINSILLVLLYHSFNFVSAILIVIYLIELVAMIILHKKFKSQDTSKSNKSVFSYVYQNYVLRQSVNFMTIILIETLLLSSKIFIEVQTPENAFVHKFVSEGVPFCVVFSLLANFSFNVFCWVRELNQDKIIEKSRIIWGLICSKEPIPRYDVMPFHITKCNDLTLTIQDLN